MGTSFHQSEYRGIPNYHHWRASVFVFDGAQTGSSGCSASVGQAGPKQYSTKCGESCRSVLAGFVYWSMTGCPARVSRQGAKDAKRPPSSRSLRLGVSISVVHQVPARSSSGRLRPLSAAVDHRQIGLVADVRRCLGGVVGLLDLRRVAGDGRCAQQCRAEGRRWGDQQGHMDVL
jgi:hypothetical protein